MPADDSLRLDEDEGPAPIGPEATQKDPQQPVRGPMPDPTPVGPLENGQMVSEGQDLNLQRGLCSKREEQPGEQRFQDSANEPGR